MNTEITIQLNDGSSEDKISFDIKGSAEKGLHVSIVNSLRRTLLSAIPTIAFKTEMDDSDLIIKKNTTPLHNEFLLHRISMIPLYLDPSEWNKNYMFHLNVSSKDGEPIQRVTTKDFVIYPLKKDIDVSSITSITMDNYDLQSPLSDKKKKEILRPFSWKQKDEYITITELKSTNEKQELELYGVPRIGVAYENARWQAVSKSAYTFKKNPELFKQALKEKIEINEVPESEWEQYKKELEISESERYFHRDDNCLPYWYEFAIDAVHFNTSKQLFIQANRILIEQLEIFKEELPKLTTEEDSIMEISSNNDETIYKLHIQGFDDTIGSVIQSYVSNTIKDDSIFSLFGYDKDHPLEDKIHYVISFNPQNKKIFESSKQQKITTLLQSLEEVCNSLINIYDSIAIEAEGSL
uniref:DNA-directed RNA polymerase RpoA/D/Rpb3-type domain-containing protein n=1 Tax=viral metagenome TaxID=1070528 RepID=A0A6C0L111_9ZZZZ|tara:strand:- start:7983 stop:9212 length:1230 start_codon:yes stop_codon:yes gene_type:complete